MCAGIESNRRTQLCICMLMSTEVIFPSEDVKWWLLFLQAGTLWATGCCPWCWCCSCCCCCCCRGCSIPRLLHTTCPENVSSSSSVHRHASVRVCVCVWQSQGLGLLPAAKKLPDTRESTCSGWSSAHCFHVALARSADRAQHVSPMRQQQEDTSKTSAWLWRWSPRSKCAFFCCYCFW